MPVQKMPERLLDYSEAVRGWLEAIVGIRIWAERGVCYQSNIILALATMSSKTPRQCPFDLGRAYMVADQATRG